MSCQCTSDKPLLLMLPRLHKLCVKIHLFFLFLSLSFLAPSSLLPFLLSYSFSLAFSFQPSLFLPLTLSPSFILSLPPSLPPSLFSPSLFHFFLISIPPSLLTFLSPSLLASLSSSLPPPSFSFLPHPPSLLPLLVSLTCWWKLWFINLFTPSQLPVSRKTSPLVTSTQPQSTFRGTPLCHPMESS